MKKVIWPIIALVMIVSLLFGAFGCAKPAPAPAPAPAPGPPSGPPPAPAAAEPIKLRVVCGVGPKSVMSWGILEPWKEMVEERTAAIGKPVEVKIFYGESLLPFGQTFKGLLDGAVDMCSAEVQDFVGGGGIGNVMQMPFFFPSTRSSALTGLDLYEKYPQFREQFSTQTKFMFFQPTAPAHGIFAAKKQIKVLEDLKGLRTRAGPTYGNEVVEALGGIPIEVEIPEIYIALERGLTDYQAKDWEACMAFKWFEVAPYHSVIPFGIYSDFLTQTMNWDTWNSLPADVQKILEELNGSYMTELAAENFDKADAELRGVISGIGKERGNPEVYDVPEDEFQRWIEAVQPIYDQFIEEAEAQGYPGRAIFEDARQLGKKYSQ